MGAAYNGRVPFWQGKRPVFGAFSLVACPARCDGRSAARRRTGLHFAWACSDVGSRSREAGSRRRLPSFLAMRPRKRERNFRPRLREQSAVGRGGRDRADQARRPASTTSEDGLALRRSTAASSRLSPRPWGPASRWSRSRGLRRSGGCKDEALGVCLTPGGRFQGRPGSRLRIVTAGAAPRSHSSSPRERPSANGDVA